MMKEFTTTPHTYNVHFSSKTDLLETPQDFFDRYNAIYGFTLDVCALPDNAKCNTYFTPEQDGLSQEWVGVCWMNPPYGRTIAKWVQKAFESAKHGATVVCLLPARHGYTVVARLLPAWRRNVRQRAVEIRRAQKQCSVSKRRCRVQA